MRGPLILLLCVLPTLARAEMLVGRADHVRDGDILVVSGVPIRLQQLAAPVSCLPLESGKDCTAESIGCRAAGAATA
jgi:hypothetical protein